MTNHKKTQVIMADAEIAGEDAERLLQRRNWNQTIRRSQEAVELALKGALHFLGVDCPKKHDVGREFSEIAEKRIPGTAQEDLERIDEGSKWLAERRALAFYREEEYSEQDAQRALGYARFTLEKTRGQVFICYILKGPHPTRISDAET